MGKPVAIVVGVGAELDEEEPGRALVASATLAMVTIVLARVEGEFTLKRYRKRGARVWLHTENPAFRDIEILDGMAFEIWGVVTSSIRML